MPDQLEGPALAAAIAVEVMGWEGNDLEGIWVPPGAAMVIECCRIDEWRPDTDPTTFFRDVVPAMRQRGYPCLMHHTGDDFSAVLFAQDWAQLDCADQELPYHITRSQDTEQNIATAGCRAALAAVRSEAAEAKKEKR